MLSTCAIETAGWVVFTERAPGAALKAGVATRSESLRATRARGRGDAVSADESGVGRLPTQV